MKNRQGSSSFDGTTDPMPGASFASMEETWWIHDACSMFKVYAHVCPYFTNMVTDRIIEKKITLQHARVPTAAGFSIISYSLKKMGKNSSAHFAFLSFISIIPLSCIFWGKPRFGLSIISWAKNGLNLL